MRTTRNACLAVAVLVFCCSAYAVEYYDHPDIGRYEKSRIIHQESSRLGEYTVGLGAARDGAVEATLAIQGKVTMTLYAGPEGASSFEISNAYRELLQSRGFEVLLACAKSDCGGKFLAAFYGLSPFAYDPNWDHSAPITQGNQDASYVLVARSLAGGRQTYVSLVVSQGWWKYPAYKLDVVEVQDAGGKIVSVGGPDRAEAGDAVGPAELMPSGPVVRRKVQLGVQAASDSQVGLLLCANRFEASLKAQAVLYDGFPGDVKPDNDMLMVGGHAAFLFRPSDGIDVGVGLDVRQGITLLGNISYRQYLDAGARLSLNYHIGERLMISGVLCPFWLAVRETDLDDSYQMTVWTPTAAVAVTLFFW